MARAKPENLRVKVEDCTYGNDALMPCPSSTSSIAFHDTLPSLLTPSGPHTLPSLLTPSGPRAPSDWDALISDNFHAELESMFHETADTEMSSEMPGDFEIVQAFLNEMRLDEAAEEDLFRVTCGLEEANASLPQMEVHTVNSSMKSESADTDADKHTKLTKKTRKKATAGQGGESGRTDTTDMMPHWALNISLAYPNCMPLTHHGLPRSGVETSSPLLADNNFVYVPTQVDGVHAVAQVPLPDKGMRSSTNVPTVLRDSSYVQNMQWLEGRSRILYNCRNALNVATVQVILNHFFSNELYIIHLVCICCFYLCVTDFLLRGNS